MSTIQRTTTQTAMALLNEQEISETPMLRSCSARVVPHPIPYQGSKRALASAILEQFPRGVGTLIEPFAGSAAVSLAAAYYGTARRFEISDINAPLMELWKKICDDPEELACEYANLWQEQIGREGEFYNIVRARFNRDHAPADFLYLLARCVKASVRYNAQGEFNQSPDNRRRGASPSLMKYHLLSASRLLRGRSTFTAQDYRAALQCAEPADVIYMDPPYQGTSGGRDTRYVQSLAYEAFVECLCDLNARGLSYILSYDGRTGMKQFGEPLPDSLNLVRCEINAGRSSQATLLGRDDTTVESLYFSPALTARWNAAVPGIGNAWLLNAGNRMNPVADSHLRTPSAIGFNRF